MYMYVCMYMYIYIYTYLHICMHIFVYKYTHMYIYTYIHAFAIPSTFCCSGNFPVLQIFGGAIHSPLPQEADNSKI